MEAALRGDVGGLQVAAEEEDSSSSSSDVVFLPATDSAFSSRSLEYMPLDIAEDSSGTFSVHRPLQAVPRSLGDEEAAAVSAELERAELMDEDEEEESTEEGVVEYLDDWEHLPPEDVVESGPPSTPSERAGQLRVAGVQSAEAGNDNEDEDDDSPPPLPPKSRALQAKHVREATVLEHVKQSSYARSQSSPGGLTHDAEDTTKAEAAPTSHTVKLTVHSRGNSADLATYFEEDKDLLDEQRRLRSMEKLQKMLGEKEAVALAASSASGGVAPRPSGRSVLSSSSPAVGSPSSGGRVLGKLTGPRLIGRNRKASGNSSNAPGTGAAPKSPRGQRGRTHTLGDAGRPKVLQSKRGLAQTRKKRSGTAISSSLVGSDAPANTNNATTHSYLMTPPLSTRQRDSSRGLYSLQSALQAALEDGALDGAALDGSGAASGGAGSAGSGGGSTRIKSRSKGGSLNRSGGIEQVRRKPSSANTLETAFGVPLSKLVHTEGELPWIVSYTLSHLSDCLELPFLFGKDTPQMQEKLIVAKKQWNKMHQVNSDPYVAAELLKVFVQCLPSSLFLGVVKDCEKVLTVGYDEYRWSSLHSIMSCLPAINRNLLRDLFTFLNKVVAHEEKNHMSAARMAAIWAPVLQLSERLVRQLILHSRHVFHDEMPDIQFLTIQGRCLIKHATIERLLVALLDQYYRVVDPAFFDVFLTAHLYFMEATELLKRLVHMYLRFTKPPLQSWQHYIRFKVLKFMNLWFEDFLDPDWISEEYRTQGWLQFLAVADGLKGIPPKEKALLRYFKLFKFSASGLVNKLRRVSVQTLSRRSAVLKETPNPMQFPARLVAEQMSLVDQRLFMAIQPIECLGGSYLDTHKAINFSNMTSKFNQWSCWVATTIVLCEDVADRSDMLAQWIRIARCCVKDLLNFNSGYAILAGLNMTAVQRLRQTWKRLPKKMVHRKEKLDELFQIEGNYRNYREALNAVIGTELPVVPYLGLYSKYLFAIEASAKTHIKQGDVDLINFSKMRLIYAQTREMLLFQRRIYMCPKEDQLFDALAADIESLSAEELYKQSKVREPGSQKSEK